jgi:hypothetical protein
MIFVIRLQVCGVLVFVHDLCLCDRLARLSLSFILVLLFSPMLLFFYAVLELAWI